MSWFQAVKYFAKSEQVLEEFGGHPSFNGIKSDCHSIVQTLKARLREQFTLSEVFHYTFQLSLICVNLCDITFHIYL